MPVEGSHKTDGAQTVALSSGNAVAAPENSSFTDIEIPKLLSDAEAIMQRISYVDQPNAIDEHAAAIEDKILDTTEKLEYTNDLLSSLTHFLSNIHHRLSFSHSVIASSWIASMAISGLNLITTPVIYLAAFILGGKPKITGKQVSNLAYSGLIFGTTLVSFLVPGAFAILGLVAAIGVTGMAVYAMAQTYHNYTSLKDKSSDKQLEIDALDAKLNTLIANAKTIHQEILSKSNKDKDQWTISLYDEIVKGHKALVSEAKTIQQERAKLDALKEKQSEYNKEIKNLHIGDVLTRGVEVALASIGLVGAVATFIFPPVGLGILAGGAALGGAYVLGRITYPWIKRAVNWFKGTKPEADPVVGQNAQSRSDPHLNSTCDVHESTAMINEELSHAAKKPHSLVSGAANELTSQAQVDTTTPSVRSDLSQAEESPLSDDAPRPH